MCAASVMTGNPHRLLRFFPGAESPAASANRNNSRSHFYIYPRTRRLSAQSSTALPAATITSGTETKKTIKACAFKCAVDNLKNVVSIAGLYYIVVGYISLFSYIISDATRHLFSCDRNSWALACLIYCGILLQSSPVDVYLYIYIYILIHSPHTRNIPSINGSGRNELEWMSNSAASLLYYPCGSFFSPFRASIFRLVYIFLLNMCCI